ncbi:hypothetical protein [uncultured Ruminobacter sp.]|uniref:hypothetical protein n=1 Tax=uncultured Ruminobacter sp. TaxID=538947 RepID=UPI0025E9A913|nr:hypothetical protein [uncultured Ruminobacter sp.]
MAFVNDNIIIKIRFNDVSKLFGIEALNGNNKMIKLFRDIRTYVRNLKTIYQVANESLS